MYIPLGLVFHMLTLAPLLVHFVLFHKLLTYFDKSLFPQQAIAYRCIDIHSLYAYSQYLYTL